MWDVPLTPFSEALNRFLTASGMTQLQLSRTTGYSASSVNRWVSGQTNPSRDRAEHLDKALSTRGELFRAWRLTATGSGLPEWARDMFAVEASAVQLSLVTPTLVPGYLQSPGYASWVFRAGRPALTSEEVQRLVKHRTERLQQLDKLRVTAVFPLAAVADLPESLRQEQAQDLLAWIQTGRVAVHLIPRGILLPAPVAPLMLFTLGTGDTVAVSDHVQGSVTLEDHSRAAALFNVALAESLPSSVSVTELEALA